MANEPEQSLSSTSFHPVLRILAVVTLTGAALAVYLVNPGERMYWPYTVAGYVLGIFVYLKYEKNRSGKGLLHYLFPKEVWAHRSAVNDCAMALINAGLVMLIYSGTALNPNMILIFCKRLGLSLAEPLAQAAHPGFALTALYTAVSLLMSDLFYYISHRLSHKVQWLWEFHKVHHSAEVMTPVTLYRMHPVDFWQNSMFRAIGLGITSLVFLYFYPGQWSIIMVSGVNVGIFIGNMIGANLRHSHIWLSFGPVVEHVILSPAQHQIHHSGHPKHSNKNYASLLTVWDWLFGSLYVPKEKEDITFGLGTPRLNKPYTTLWGMYWHPFRKIFN